MEPASMGKTASESDLSLIASKTEVNVSLVGKSLQSGSYLKSETQIQSKTVKSCSSSSSSGSSSTGSESTSSEDTSSSGSSESVESSRHHRHRAKHVNSRKLKRYSSSSDKEHSKRNNLRAGKGLSPNKKGSHSVSAVNASALHKEMKHTKKRRSRDRSAGRSSPRKGGLGSTSGLKKSLSPLGPGLPGRSSNANSHKRRSQSPMLKGGKLGVQSSKLGLNSRNIGPQHNARSPPNHKGSRDRDRNREKEEREREREMEKEKERERENKKQRERELEKQRERERDREKEREKDRNRSRSPKMKMKEVISRSPRKDLKRRESPDPHHKPGRLSGGSQKGRDDGPSSKHKAPVGDHWHRKDDKEEDRKRGDERRHKDDSRKDARLLTGLIEKEHIRDRDRDRERERVHDREREKDKTKSLLQQGIPSLLTLNLHPNDFNAHAGGGGKERGVERNRSLERTGLLRNISMDRGRERSLDRVSERSRGSERDRRCRNNNGGLEKGLDHSGLEKELAKALARNREQERTFERNERVPERGLERGPDRGLDRGLERGLDRSVDRGLERGMDRNIKNERGLDRASPRVLDRDNDRGLERGLDRDPVQGRLERGFDRALERGLERGSPRLDRDHRFSDRSPGDRLFGATHLDHRESDDKGFDGMFEGRRDRGRFSDQSRYEKGVPLNDDRRMGPSDSVGFNEDRRRGRDGNRQEGRVGQWDARNERKRDHNHEREHGREREHGPRPYDGGQRPPGPNNPGKRNDWEWDQRGRRSGKDWDGPHRPDNSSVEKEWGRFPPGQNDWSGPPGDRRSGGWNDEWRSNNQNSPAAQLLQNRPPGRMLPLRDDSQNLLHKTDDLGTEEGLKGKDQTVLSDNKNDTKVDAKIENDTNHTMNHKRTREIGDGDDVSADSKRPYLEKDSALDEVLSDISDDADEILNREDSELNQLSHGDTAPAAGKENRLGNQQSALLSQANQAAASHTHHRRTGEGGENSGNLGFEEISDGELEEEARARGISDALGVDWASLVAETRPRLKIEKAGSTRQRWEGVTLLTYIGVSVEYAGPKLVKYILNSALSPQQDTSDKDSTIKVDEVSSSQEPEDAVDKASCSGVVEPGKQETNAKSEGVSDNDKQCGHSKTENLEEHPSINETDKLDISISKSLPAAENSLKANSEFMASGAKSKMVSDSKIKDTPSDSKCSVKSNCDQAGGGEESVHEPQRNKTVKQENENQDKQQCFKLLHPVAGIHAALLERKARRQALFSSSGPYKRALSARRDLAIRRQLCNLPPRETTCDNNPAADELFRLSLQLLERAS
ncbi:zinc finger CCCH domain-containing protein 13-like isoform X2 [Thrips palmi]|uniref:Zinc finger CCCH domain-containing protein 13-like isoform X2 n=1 Tax=Thrips palmi TaxID=161013 RepID=A0A6P8YJ41_THRPL|nr:zinc finger CCCH domain-containing protein 13-like isoform X2 [Thrips palmi]